MGENIKVIKSCTDQGIDALVEFAFRINNDIKHSSTFCSSTKSGIQKDIANGIKNNSVAVCIIEDCLVGVLNCYIDSEKNNADCMLLIDSTKCNYNDVAKDLFIKIKSQFDDKMKYTFFFPKQNTECSSFLEAIQARQEVNEYCLIFTKDQNTSYKSSAKVTELTKDYYEQFIELHDKIFPGVYISGKEVINDIGKNHFVFSIVENGCLNAYGVFRIYGAKRATAEIIGVRDSFRGKGYGRAILGHLIYTAFSTFNTEIIDLIVDGDNKNAISLYLDMGFTIESENCCYIA